jgi:hypothetical protein
MKWLRTALITCALVAFGIAGSSAAAAGSPGTGSGSPVTGSGSPTPLAAPPRAQLAQFACVHALDPENRSVSVRAVMRPLTGTRRMAIKFDLYEQTPGAAFASLGKVGGLGAWVLPDTPTLGQLPGDVWRLDKDVINLPAPAAYQFHVTFRWTGLHGRTIGTAVRRSRTCRQPELRPDLLVQSIIVSAIAGHPQKDLYTATIANQGATGAGPFEVLFTPGDSSAPTVDTLAFLGAHKSRQLSFEGPVCNATSPPSVTVDAADQVDDYNRANNILSAVCPAPSSTPTVSLAHGGRR